MTIDTVLEPHGPSMYTLSMIMTYYFWKCTSLTFKCTLFTYNHAVNNSPLYINPRNISMKYLHIQLFSKDYDEWSSLGVDGWSYDEVLPFFKKSENYVNELPQNDSKKTRPLDFKNIIFFICLKRKTHY